MNSRLIFHLGLPKTGSTYLQRHIFPFIEGGHFIRGRFLEDVVQSLTCDDNKPVLVSNENLSVRPTFGAAPGEYRSKRSAWLRFISETWPRSGLLLFFREPASFLPSLYKQYIYSGGRLDFRGWRETYRIEDALRFDDFIDEVKGMPWGDLLFFDHAQLINDPVPTLNRISEFLGCYIPTTTAPVEATNSSIDRAGVRFLARVNRPLNRSSHWALSRFANKAAKRLHFHPRHAIQGGALRFLNNCGSPIIEPRDLEELRIEFSGSWERALEKIYSTQ